MRRHSIAIPQCDLARKTRPSNYKYVCPMEVNLPEFFVALALSPDGTDAQSEMGTDVAKCDDLTSEFLTHKLQSRYPQLETITIKTKEFEWNSKRAPAERFQAYFVMEGFLRLSEGPSQSEDEVFDAIGTCFDAYYLDFLKQKSWRCLAV